MSDKKMCTEMKGTIGFEVTQKNNYGMKINNLEGYGNERFEKK